VLSCRRDQDDTFEAEQTHPCPLQSPQGTNHTWRPDSCMAAPPATPSSAWPVAMLPSAAVGARTPTAQPPARPPGAANSAPMPATTLRDLVTAILAVQV